jgi:membrane protein YdbS with pleckstrin-like domain
MLSWKRAWWTTITSNKISIKFIKNVFEKFEENDEILNKEEVEKESIATSKQDIWNSIFVYIILLIIVSVWILFSGLAILLLLLIPFLIIIWLIIWSIKVKFYDYQKDRILFSSWIIYKQKHSILYKKFNYVEFNKWFVNKIFKNWNIKIYTLWSWSIDLLIKDIPNYREVYNLFKKD